ncbi:hypothetical protein ABZP36_012890 [Zizania latifolia]
MLEQCSEEHKLTSELARVLAMARELEAHMGQDSAAERELCRALASSVDRSIRLARPCFPPEMDTAGARAATAPPQTRPPDSRRGKPILCIVSVIAKQSFSFFQGISLTCVRPRRRCRKGMTKVRRQVRVTAYFRCTHRHTQSCNATKQVQRTDGDPLLFDVVYLGEHTCGQAPAAAKRAPTPARAEPLQLELEHVGMEQQGSLLAVETGGVHQGVESMMAGVDSYFSFVSPANSDC